jgi:hypothetical protein
MLRIFGLKSTKFESAESTGATIIGPAVAIGLRSAKVESAELTWAADEHAWRITHGNRINRTTFIQVSSLFDFPPSLLPQAYHSFHIPITLSANYRPHGIDQCPAISSLEVLLSTGLAPYTHTVQPHTALATQSSIATSSLNFYQFSRAYFHFNRMHQESWDPFMAVLRPSSIFKFNYGAAFRAIAATFIISSTFDSIDRISTATMATHATRRCNTSSTRNVCDWCDLVIFLV